MKYLWTVFTFIVSLFILCADSHAIAVQPSSGVTKQVSPLLISGYSFQGSSIRYVQLYNLGEKPILLNGWKLSSVTSAGVYDYATTMNGIIAPNRYATIAPPTVLPDATFSFAARTAVSSDPLVQSIVLTPPDTTNFMTVSTAISVTSSTVRDSLTSPATFYFTRNISTTSGEYLSTYTANNAAPTTLLSDSLYEPADAPKLKIVEMYPDAPTCSPIDLSLLCTDYVKLQNTSDMPIDLSQYRLRTGSFGQSSTSANTVVLSGVLGAGEYISPVISLSASGNFVWLEDTFGYHIYDGIVTEYPSASGHDRQAYSYDDTTQDWKWNDQPRPGNQPNYFEPLMTVNKCEGLKLSEIAANVEKQYIELFNSTDTPIDISGCQIQTNRSSTQSYVFSEGASLPSNAFFVVPIQESDLTLTKTTSGTVYVLTSDGKTEVDARDYDKLKTDTAYSLIDGQWLQSYAMTPGAPNIYMQYPLCEAGYERNYQTGNCNKVSATSSLLAVCDLNEYRSSETNRCRKLASTTASALSPCSNDQYRSLETNRCRNLATASSDLKQCASNQERNPETNRCRLVSGGTIPEADFPVDQKNSNVSGSLAGWMAFAAVGSLAVGYGAWEWRREIIGPFRKLLGTLHK